MREFFKGWRRKTGVVTLAMTLLFAAMWIRCREGTEVVGISSVPINRAYYIMSQQSKILWWGCDDESHLLRGQPDRRWVRLESSEALEMEFQLGSRNRFYSTTFRLWIIPYWAIVLSLSLLSPYLLFSKPRQKTPVPEEPPEPP